MLRSAGLSPPSPTPRPGRHEPHGSQFTRHSFTQPLLPQNGAARVETRVRAARRFSGRASVRKRRRVGETESRFQAHQALLTPSTRTPFQPLSPFNTPPHHRWSGALTKASTTLRPGSIPARARGSGERYRLGGRCHGCPAPSVGRWSWQTRRCPGCAVVSVWSVEPVKHPQSRHSWRAFPQVRALPPPQRRTPKAGVAGSNPARRAECLCRSRATTVPRRDGCGGYGGPRGQ